MISGPPSVKNAWAPTTDVPFDLVKCMSWITNVLGSSVTQFVWGGPSVGHTRWPFFVNWPNACATKYFCMALLTLDIDAFSMLLGLCQGGFGYVDVTGKRADVSCAVPAA